MSAKIPAPLFLAALVAFTACGDPAGTPCEITGSGFQASHGCRHQCLSRWQVTCPNGESLLPKFCSGAFSCTPGSCPDGQVCYHDDDPFDDRSFCVMSTTCGDLGDDVLSEWEVDRVARHEHVRTEREEREARRARWRAENPGPKTASPASSE